MIKWNLFILLLFAIAISSCRRDDDDDQKSILEAWTQKVKELSEIE